MRNSAVLKAGQDHERSAPAVVKSRDRFSRRRFFVAVKSHAVLIAKENIAAAFRDYQYVCGGRDH
jgi:hypothetical protein